MLSASDFYVSLIPNSWNMFSVSYSFLFIILFGRSVYSFVKLKKPITNHKSLESNSLSLNHSAVVHPHFGSSVKSSAALLDRKYLTTLSTSLRQLNRLFQAQLTNKWNSGIRIIFGWMSLVIAKALIMASPLFFKELINTSKDVDKTNISSAIFANSMLGLILGFGLSKFASGLVQYFGDIIVHPLTISASEILPIEAYSSALKLSTRSKQMQKSASEESLLQTTPSSARALDRGLRASNLFMYRAVYNLMPAILEVLFVVGLMITKAGVLVGITASIIAITYIVVTFSLMQKRIPKLRQQYSSEATAFGFAEDAIVNSESVKAFGTRMHEINVYKAALNDVSDSCIASRKSFSQLKCVQSAILGIGATLILLATCVPFYCESWKFVDFSKLAISSSLTSNLILVQALFAQLYSPLDRVGHHFRDCVTAAEDLKDLELITLQEETYSRENKYFYHNDEMIKDFSENSSSFRLEARNISYSLHSPPPSQTNLLNSLNNSIQNDELSTRRILQNVSINIPSGGYALGIVGPSGSGKSCLIRNLLGLDDIDVDSSQDPNFFGLTSIAVNGHIVTNYDRTSLFSYVGQDNDLFRGLNIAENVAYGALSTSNLLFEFNSTASKIALENAARDAELNPVIEKLSDGWKSKVGPRGRLLSGGERQRICIARALFREELTNSILLLDEATSQLDSLTESNVMNAIYKRVKENKSTVILVAHRLKCLQRCHHIVVMKDGCITEEGTHEKLLQLNGWYAEAWRLQQLNKH